MITLRQYSPGEIIIRENEPGDTAYIVASGRVKVTTEVEGQHVHLAYLSEGATIGEMSMVDDMPRCATVTAVEETVLQEIRRDTFFQSIRQQPEIAIDLLKVLFERLREANMTVAQLKAGCEEAAGPGASVATRPPRNLSVAIRGVTVEAAESLPQNPFYIRKFPFRIGRKDQDPLVMNDLCIEDTQPWQVSRHHVSIVLQDGKVGIFDRGSQLGAMVNGRRIGGVGNTPGPVFLTPPEGMLVLGVNSSPFRYQILISTL